MKKILIIVFAFSFCLYNIYANTTLPLVGKQIIIDPGHGGKDPGVVVDNLFEKDINLNISLKLKEQLETLGASVLLTREGDYDLSSPNAYFRKKSDFNNRIKLINNPENSLYISVHMNYLSEKKYYGTQIFYTSKNKNLADFMQKELNSERKAKTIDTYMYDYLKTPGFLIECGFLSNENEKNNFLNNEYIENYVKNVASALVKYYS